MTDERQAAFLAELTELSRRHRIAIGGCGCCGSPWLTELTPTPTDVMIYEGVDGKYAIGEVNDEIVWVKP